MVYRLTHVAPSRQIASYAQLGDGLDLLKRKKTAYIARRQGVAPP